MAVYLSLESAIQCSHNDRLTLTGHLLTELNNVWELRMRKMKSLPHSADGHWEHLQTVPRQSQ